MTMLEPGSSAMQRVHRPQDRQRPVAAGPRARSRRRPPAVERDRAPEHVRPARIASRSPAAGRRRPRRRPAGPTGRRDRAAAGAVAIERDRRHGATVGRHSSQPNASAPPKTASSAAQAHAAASSAGSVPWTSHSRPVRRSTQGDDRAPTSGSRRDGPNSFSSSTTALRRTPRSGSASARRAPVGTGRPRPRRRAARPSATRW